MFLSPHLLRLATDARLVALVRERNPAAFEAVYNRHHRAILSFCRHMLGDAQEAEDAVQQTFLAAYSDLISSEKPIHLRAWLFTIARNRCYSLLRGRREQPTSELEEPITEGLASQVQRRQDLRDLVVDLRRLPDDQRAALVLAELDALTHEEIAIALGVPREKVKALVFQARESLVASRTARETDCADIREQLATQRGGALRRGNLRRHLRECAGCREFRHQVEHQRRQLAALLPVAPTVALKEGVLGATAGGGAAAGVGTGGLMLSTALKSGLAKGALGALLAGAGAATTIVATHGLTQTRSPTGSHHQRAAAASAPTATGAELPAATASETAVSAGSSAPRVGATTTAGLGEALPRASSNTYGGSGSFIRRAAVNPFAPLLGIPTILKGGTAPRSQASMAPPPAASAPAATPAPATPITAAPPPPTATVPSTTPSSTPTTHGSNPHDTSTGATNRGDGSSAGGRTGSSGGGHAGGGDTGSGTPVPQRGGSGSSAGGTRGQGATGSSGAGGSTTGTTGNTGTTGTTGNTGTGSTGTTGTGNTGTGSSTTGNTGTGRTPTTATATTSTSGSGSGAAGSGSAGSTSGTDSSTEGGAKTASIIPAGTTRGVISVTG